MAIRDFEMNIKNADGSFDTLHPVTKIRNVIGLNDKIIVERGSNSNGHYIKFGDGTMVCCGSKKIEGTNWSYSGTWGGYYSGNTNIVFPASFAKSPYVATGNFDNQTNPRGSWSNITLITEMYINVRAMATKTFDRELFINYIAVGQWE